jgi:flavin-dependent dehydrogenase
MLELDLLIIGGGPAGLSTALHLLQQDPGWSQRMLVVEKASHPRQKLCGGGLTRLGLDLLIGLGFELPLPIPQARVEDARLVYQGRTVHVRGWPQFVVFHRAEFDAFLAGQARQRGAAIREGEAVQSLAIGSQGVTVWTDKETYLAQAVVGADGSKGLTRRLVGETGGRSRVARLLEVVHPAPPGAPHFGDRYAVFDFTPVQNDLQGYFWDFPARVDGQACFNRGVYDSRCVPQRPRARLPYLLGAELAARGTGPASVNVQGHPIHWFSPRNRFSRPRLLLAGDSAGVDPLFGEGIAPAIGYGQVAAQALQQAFATRDFSFADYRRRLLRSPLGRYLLLRWFVAHASYRLSGKPWFMHSLWSLGAALNATWPKPPPLDFPSAARDSKT